MKAINKRGFRKDHNKKKASSGEKELTAPVDAHVFGAIDKTPAENGGGRIDHGSRLNIRSTLSAIVCTYRAGPWSSSSVLHSGGLVQAHGEYWLA